MLILAVDTTTPSGSAALLNKGELVAEAGVHSFPSHSERLLGTVDFLLKMNRLDIKELDGFAVAAGPGSFTGIRIGLGTIKSFAYASGKPVAPVSTLRALAWKLKDSPARLLCPLIDAKKGEIYAALFEARGRDLKEVVPPGAYSPGRFFPLLPSRRVISFIGSGIELCRGLIDEYLKDKARIPSRSLFIAHEVGSLGYERLRKGRGLSAEEIEPLYYRKSQAEDKR